MKQHVASNFDWLSVEVKLLTEMLKEKLKHHNWNKSANTNFHIKNKRKQNWAEQQFFWVLTHVCRAAMRNKAMFFILRTYFDLMFEKKKWNYDASSHCCANNHDLFHFLDALYLFTIFSRNSFFFHSFLCRKT